MPAHVSNPEVQASLVSAAYELPTTLTCRERCQPNVQAAARRPETPQAERGWRCLQIRA